MSCVPFSYLFLQGGGGRGCVHPPRQHAAGETRDYWTGFSPVAFIPVTEPTAHVAALPTAGDVFQ